MDEPFSIVRPETRTADEAVVIVKAVQTAIVCPSQWDAWDEQGRYFYLRHRNGRGSVDQFADPNPETWGTEPLGSIAHFRGELEGLDGQDREELESFCGQAGITLAPDARLVTYEEYVRGIL